MNLVFADMALRPELARAIGGREQAGRSCFEQLLGPIPIARLHRLGMASQSAAAVQADDDGKRTVAFWLVKLRMQYAVLHGDIDLLRSGHGRCFRRRSD